MVEHSQLQKADLLCKLRKQLLLLPVASDAVEIHHRLLSVLWNLYQHPLSSEIPQHPDSESAAGSVSNQAAANSCSRQLQYWPCKASIKPGCASSACCDVKCFGVCAYSLQSSNSPWGCAAPDEEDALSELSCWDEEPQLYCIDDTESECSGLSESSPEPEIDPPEPDINLSGMFENDGVRLG